MQNGVAEKVEMERTVNVEVDMVDDMISDDNITDQPPPSLPEEAMEVNVQVDNDTIELPDPQKKYNTSSDNDYMTDDEDDPDDLYKPEGTIFLDIDSFGDFCKGTAEMQQRLSKPVYVRGLPWKILAIPRDTNRCGARPNKALGFFLQCNGDSDAVAWNCIASATLKVLGQADGFEDHCRRISHTFYPKENDWGYSQFLSCEHLSNPENGYIKDDTIRLVVHVSADAPHGVQWDSKKHAGYIGLKNQGATCYMNSILQTLFFTTKLRKAVYEMPVSQDDSENNVALAMQRVFYDLQHSDRPVGTKKLTKSFGWDSLETFMQHDVQELCRVLLDNLESKMKHSAVEDTIPNLFRGLMKSYIRCTNVNFESSREEAFYDIQLNIKGKNDIIESFREYTQVERLDGENKYDAGQYGMQPAEKGVKFVSFPPVLHLQLMRFQYDAQLDANVKINDRFEFPDRLNLNEFVEENGDEDNIYCLHAVLVHSGDFHGGHYVVFINTNLKAPSSKSRPKWCKFDDDVVSRATVRDAVVANYGGDDSESAGRTFTNAYMLVYVKQNCISDVLCSYLDEEIPRHLVVRFEGERAEENKKKKEKQEAHLYTEIVMLTEEHLRGHHGFDLIDTKLLEEDIRRERIEKGMTVSQLYEYVADKLFNTEQLRVPVESFRVWKFEETSFKEEGSHVATLNRLRPTALLPLGEDGHEKTLDAVLDNDRNLLFIEGPVGGQLPKYNESTDMLMFLKFYNDKQREIAFVGHLMVGYRNPLSVYLSECRQMIGLPEDTPLRFYEEVSPDKIRLIENQEQPLCSENLLLEVSDGGVLIFENASTTNDTNNAKAHLDTIYNTIEIEAITNNDTFVASHAEVEPPILGTIELNWTMHQLVEFIGNQIHFDPSKILLWRVSPFNERATQYLTDSQFKILRVRELLGLIGAQIHDPRRNKRYRVIYTKMPINVADMERKRQMKVQLMDDKMNISEVTIFPERTGTVANIIEEAKREFKFSEYGTGKLRLVYVGQSGHTLRVYQVFKDDVSVMEVFQKTMTPSMYMGRVEEIPDDQLVVRSNEYLVPIAHFDKEPGRMFGVPFFLKVANDEPLQSVRERIQAKLEVSDKEFEKYKFALISSTRIVRYLDMESNGRVNLAELGHTHVSSLATSPYLGLDHMNKSRGSRGSHTTEKAIVIHN